MKLPISKILGLLKSKWFWIIAVIVIVFTVAIFVLAGRGEDAEYVLAEVERGYLVQTVDATGDLESLDKVDLSFQASGNVQEIFVSVGDEVVAGDYLAILDADELTAQANQAQQAVDIAQANLDLEITGAASETIAVKMADVRIAEASHRAAESNYTHIQTTEAAAVTTAEIAYETEQDDYDNTLASNILDLSDSKEDYVNAMKSAMVEVRAGLSDADQVLGIENPLLNYGFEKILSGTNPQALTDANRWFGFAQDSRDDAEDAVFVLSADSTDEELSSASDLVEDALYDAALTLLYTHQVLDATTLETSDFSTADLLVLKTTINTARTQIQTEEAAFFTDKQSYENAKIDTSIAEVNAYNDLVAAEQAYIKALAQEASNVASYSAALDESAASLEKAEAMLAELIAGPRSVDLAAYYADVRRAQADLDAALARLAAAEIVSPIDGRVTNIAIEVGEQATAATKVITIQTIEDHFQIVLNVSESDIAKVSLNDPAEITFDAFGDDMIVNGYVGTIDPAEEMIESVVYYQVGIFFSDEVTLEIKPGMSADVIITTEEIADTLFVPRRAVLEADDGSRYVRVPKLRGYDEVTVEVGLKADEGRIEILSGVEEGEEIIVTIR
ncbi:MAG: efflux RND transporter periplasmic adaptor subunit [bacterium]